MNEVLIKHNKNWGLSEDLVKRKALEALRFYKLNNVELSICFVGRKKARELNIEYRQKDYYPQVLEFPMSKEPDKDGKIRLGDIVVCTQKLKYEVIYMRKTVEIILDEWMKYAVGNLIK